MFAQEGGPWVEIWLVTRALKVVWKEGPKMVVEGDAKVEEEEHCRFDLTVVAEEERSSYAMLFCYVGSRSEFAQWVQE